MELDYNCTGADRKNLVAVLADHTGQKAKYLGAPSFAYQVDCITIDKNGAAAFTDLDFGLYLVVQKTAASGYKKTAPFLVSVPYLDDGAYVYAVASDPKTELEREVKPTTPTPPHSSSDSGGKLVQTGQLWWPVPVLICAGLGCIAVGLIRRREGSE